MVSTPQENTKQWGFSQSNINSPDLTRIVCQTYLDIYCLIVSICCHNLTVVGKLPWCSHGSTAPAKILHWSLPADLPAVLVTTDLPAGSADRPIRGMPKKKWDANLYPNVYCMWGVQFIVTGSCACICPGLGSNSCSDELKHSMLLSL